MTSMQKSPSCCTEALQWSAVLLGVVSCETHHELPLCHKTETKLCAASVVTRCLLPKPPEHTLFYSISLRDKPGRVCVCVCTQEHVLNP